jgi:hypothetical protein
MAGAAHYSPAEQEAALRLAARIGVTAAARELGIAKSTINRFRHWNPELWSDLISGQEVATNRRQRTAESLEDLAEAYTEREFEALQRAEKLIKTADGKELAALMRAMGASRGVAHANSRAYRGEDVQTVEHNINFAALEQAAQAILARANPRPQLVENLAEREEA